MHVIWWGNMTSQEYWHHHSFLVCWANIEADKLRDCEKRIQQQQLSLYLNLLYLLHIFCSVSVSFTHCNAQGHVLCAEALNQILVTRDGQSRLLAAFIHRVVPLHETVSTLRTDRSNKTSWLATWRDRNIFLHKTHVGMTVQVSATTDAFGTANIRVYLLLWSNWCRQSGFCCSL